MEIFELSKRIEELKSRTEKTNTVTNSLFLTPAEQYKLKGNKLFLVSGNDNAERKIAVFLPDWMDKESFEISDILSCVKINSFYGIPTHRDYLGAVLGLGIKREWIGDILVDDDCAYVICIKSVMSTIIDELTKVGRVSVKATEWQLSDIPAIKTDTKELTFTVMSLRLDAVCGEMFSISRSSAAEKIRQGVVSLNYEITDKVDASVGEGDVISMHGKGKGFVFEIGGLSKKGRIYVKVKLLK